MPYPDLDTSKLPQIVYQNSYGLWVTLNFETQISNPSTPKEFDVAQTITLNGTPEVCRNRIDEYFTFTMKHISDAHKLLWDAFHEEVWVGSSFKFIPDRSVPGTFYWYVCLEKKWTPERMMPVWNLWTWQERWYKVES